MGISGINHAASAPALLRFAFRVAIHAQGWLPAGWLAFTGRVSNPLDHCERFQITWSSPFPVLLTLHGLPSRLRRHHGRCTPDSGRLAAMSKSAPSGQKEKSRTLPHAMACVRN
jgi:hypothetical protein